MIDEDIYTKRRQLNEDLGDAFLGDAARQSELRFTWNGRTIDDALIEREYFYPSTIGMALYFHGSFEIGEIATASGMLEGVVYPVVFDIGANIGLHAAAWCAAHPTLRVFAFEPVAANRDLFARNVARAGATDRVVLSGQAVAGQVGRATFTECDDSAYSTLADEAAMPVADRYDVATTTVDTVVKELGIQRVDLLKIDVEGFERDVLRGADAVIKRDFPFIFIEISGSDRTGGPKETIDQLVARGYAAYAISDGLVTPYDRYDPDSRNYLFVPIAREARAPVTQAVLARSEAAYRTVLIKAARRQLVHLRRELKEKDDEIRRLKTAAEERLQLIDDLSDRSADRQRAEQNDEAVASEQRRSESQRALAAERELKIADLEARLAAATSDDPAVVAAGSRMLTSLRVELEGRDEVIAQLRAATQMLREELDRQHHAATERLKLIHDMEARMRQTGGVANERAGVIDRIQAGLEAREGDLAAMRARVEHLRIELTSKDAVIDKLEGMLGRIREEGAGAREESGRAAARIAELEALAEERLEVIRSLNKDRAG